MIYVIIMRPHKSNVCAKNKTPLPKHGRNEEICEEGGVIAVPPVVEPVPVHDHTVVVPVEVRDLAVVVGGPLT